MRKLFVIISVCLLATGLIHAQGMTIFNSNSIFVPPSVFQSNENATALASPVSVAYNSNNVSGHILLNNCAGFFASGPPTLTITDSNNSYTSATNTSGGSWALNLEYATSISGANTVNCASNQGALTSMDLIITELANVTAIDQHTSATNTSGALVSPSITTTTANEIVCETIFDNHTSHTWGVPSGWTQIQHTINPTGETSAMACQVFSTIQTGLTMTWTNNGTTSNAISMAAVSFR
jgi:hypothetical protein